MHFYIFPYKISPNCSPAGALSNVNIYFGEKRNPNDIYREVLKTYYETLSVTSGKQTKETRCCSYVFIYVHLFAGILSGYTDVGVPD